MNCPVCNNSRLNTAIYESQEIDYCQKCGGIWFDKGELFAIVNGLLSKGKIDPQTVKEAYRDRLISPEKEHSIKRGCPRCRMEMNLVNYSYDSNIIIDKCSSCDGIWTDAGEMRSVAKYIKGNPEVYSYAKALTEVSDACRKSRSKKGRIIASLIALVYLMVGFSGMGLEGLFKALGFVFAPLAFIFYGEALGDVTGGRLRATFIAPIITKSSPGSIVVFLGWVWLVFAPIAIFAILKWGV
ncbi:MAG: hypothetical protein DRP64_04925 [Verrucomicrobia bacterium]|nr:MAG: hypothetical protein DRP64_04925 [Verrucomicrobiota bacterium]